MFHWLHARLVQQVPESLSVCEFGCPVSRCTAVIWSTCKLRNLTEQNGIREARVTGLADQQVKPRLARLFTER
jgi:hypothetical protein